MSEKQLSETELINRTRLDLFSGPGTTRLVATFAERKRSQSRKRPRIIAVGRSANGQPFQVSAPPDDFIESAQPVRQPVRPPADWPTPDEIDAIIGTACYGLA